MRVAICDDEKIFFRQIEYLFKQIEGISCVDTYDDIEKLYQTLEKQTYDLIFMDIAWKGQKDTGVQFASSINEKHPNIQFVFVTAFNDKFAESIFFEKVNLCGYLIKPIKMNNLQFLMEKAKKNITRSQGEKILIKLKGNTRTVLYSDMPNNVDKHIKENTTETVPDNENTINKEDTTDVEQDMTVSSKEDGEEKELPVIDDGKEYVGETIMEQETENSHIIRYLCIGVVVFGVLVLAFVCFKRWKRKEL